MRSTKCSTVTDVAWNWTVETLTHFKQGDSSTTLQRLRDAILEGNHPLLASLKDRSGLVVASRGGCDQQASVNDLDEMKKLKFVGEVKNLEEHDCEPETYSYINGYDGERTNVSTKKDAFLSSQCKRNKDRSGSVVASRGGHDQGALVIDLDESNASDEMKKMKSDGRSKECEAKNLAEHDCEPEKYSDINGYDGERTDVSTKKDAFLSSQCTRNKDRSGSVVASRGGHDQRALVIDLDESEGSEKMKKMKSDGRSKECEAKILAEHVCEPKMYNDINGYDDERTDIATKKDACLSSQCTQNKDLMATTDWTEVSLCMKCNEGGQLLFCSSDACPLIVHESCLGLAATYDESAKFYCPVCAYSQAISKHLEVKKKKSLTRKEVASFIGLIGSRIHCESKNSSKIFSGSMQNELRQVEEAGKKGVQECQSPTGMEEQSPTGMGEQQVSAQAVDLCEPRTSSSKGNIGLRSGEHVEIQIQSEVLNYLSTDLPLQPVCPSSSLIKKCQTEEKLKSFASSYSIRTHKRKPEYTYPSIPLVRRKRLRWTKLEEEKLKEGVQTFWSVDDGDVPWKKILEFGGNVFEKSRTTIDLKDKWRNICKGRPKRK